MIPDQLLQSTETQLKTNRFPVEYGPLYGPLYMEPVEYRLSYSLKISYHVDMNSDIQCLISFALISIDRFRYFLYNDSNRGFVH